MVRYSRDIISVTLIKSEEALFGLVIPHFNMAVVSPTHQVGLVETHTEVQAVHSCLMTHQAVVGSCLLGGDSPDLDGLVKGGRGKHCGVFGVDLQLHYVVFVVFIGVNFLPILIPVK